MMRRTLTVLLLFLTACQPDPTPFPVNVPPTQTQLPSAQSAPSDVPAAVRYALASNTTNALPDLSTISASAQIEFLTEPVNPTDLDTRYDIVVAYGDFPEGTRSPVMPHVSLLLNTSSPPLDNSLLLSTLRQAIDTRAVVNTLAIPAVNPDTSEAPDTIALRTALANAGFPDGFVMNGASAYVPGTQAIQSVLASSTLDTTWMLIAPEMVETAISSGHIQLGLVMWTTPETRAVWEEIVGAENVIDLFSVPISYLAADGLTITFTSNGFPLATR